MDIIYSNIKDYIIADNQSKLKQTSNLKTLLCQSGNQSELSIKQLMDYQFHRSGVSYVQEFEGEAQGFQKDSRRRT
jgi:hypothetical protein